MARGAEGDRGPDLAQEILTPRQQTDRFTEYTGRHRAPRADKVLGALTTLLNSVRPMKEFSFGKSDGGA